MENVRKYFLKIWPLLLNTTKCEKPSIPSMFLVFHSKNERRGMKVIIRKKFKNFSKDISVYNLESVSFFLYLLTYLFV